MHQSNPRVGVPLMTLWARTEKENGKNMSGTGNMIIMTSEQSGQNAESVRKIQKRSTEMSQQVPDGLLS